MVLSLVASACQSQGPTEQPQIEARVAPDGFRRLAYLPEWLDLSEQAQKINYSCITHLCLAFGNPDNSLSMVQIKDAEIVIRNSHAAGIKVFLSVGGGDTWTDGPLRRAWAKMMEPSNRHSQAKALAYFVATQGYDGLDLDLEGQSINSDYPEFVMALGQALRANPDRPLGFSAALPALPSENPFLTRQCLAAFDWVNLMVYDVRGPWYPNNPGQHAPLSLAKEAIAAYRAMGLDRRSIVIGIPLYGYGYGLSYRRDCYEWKEIVSRWPNARDSDYVKTGAFGSGIYYNGFRTVGEKTILALEEAGGIMFWQIGGDAPGQDSLCAYAASLCKK